MSRLGPGDVPSGREPVRVIHGGEEGITDDGDDLTPQMIEEMLGKLAELRKPFAPEQIEKLPKPIRKGAWEGRRGARCDICHGYHVIEDSIHLDYVGHANTTNRLLEVDPMWDWEPLAYTEAGLPLFDKVGGLWIRLTICGVTRLGYGDGASPKEIIGDAIRNAAMRFGVALDLWSKIDLHAERNPGDGETSQRNVRRENGSNVDSGSGGRNAQGHEVASDAPPAPNQDALDSLGSVCDDNGFDRRTMRDEYDKWATKKRYKERELLTADSERIMAFAAHLLEGVEPAVDHQAANAGQPQEQPEPAAPGTGEPDAGADTAGQEAGDMSGDEAQAHDLDTADVEKQPGEMF